MIRILIADDHAILRRGLKEILVRELEDAICGEAGDAQQALSQVQNQDESGRAASARKISCDTESRPANRNSVLAKSEYF